MNASRTRTLVTSALLVALLAASALVTIPVGTVPVTLQTLIVAIVVLICPPAQAALVVGLYLVLGAAGAPVFSGARGGLAALVGPTGGYLVGFWLGAVAGSLVRVALPARRSLADTAALGIALVCVYLPGTAWLALSTGRTMAEAVIVGAAPFVVFDIAKGVGAASVVAALRRAGLVPAPSRSAGAEPSQAVC